MREKYFAFLAPPPSFLFAHGYANGYVAIPPSNRSHGKHYSEVEVDVHGGLTFGHLMEPLKKSKLINEAEPINFSSFDDIPDDYWVFGFDTLHFNDGPHLDREWYIEETKRLMEQLRTLK